MTTTETQPAARPLPGPNLLALGIVFVVLFLAGLVGGTLAAGTTFPSPFDPPARILAYFAQHPTGALLTGFFQFAAAVPLLLFTAVVYARLRHFKIAVPGAVITLVSGIASSVFLMLSGILSWALS